MFRKLLASASVVVVTGALSLLALAAPADAAGSDSAVSYTITAASLSLPTGQVFSDNGINDGNVKYIPIAQYTPGETYTHPGADWVVQNINFHIEQNPNTGKAMIGASTLPFDRAASDGAFRGQLPSAGYCIVWVQVQGFNEHFGEGGQAPICSGTPDATAALSTTAGSCSAAGTLVLGTIAHASWGTPSLTSGPGAYTVVATADAGHLFSDGASTQTFTGSLDAQTTVGCGPQSVTVATAPSATPASCDAAGSLVLPAQAHIVWSGAANGAGPGAYTVTAAVDDAAAYTLSGTSSWTITVPARGVNLDGSQLSCVLDRVIVTPDATAVPGCGTTGTIAWTERPDEIRYALTKGDGHTGVNEVTATAIAPYVFDDLTSTRILTFDLGAPAACGEPSASVSVDPCTAQGADRATASGTATFTFDNRAASRAVTFEIPSEGLLIAVAAGHFATMDLTVPASGGSYSVTADGAPLTTLRVPALGGCLPTLADFTIEWSAAPAACQLGGGAPMGTITVGPDGAMDYVAYFLDGQRVTSPTTSLTAGAHVLTASAIDPADTVDNPGPHTVTVPASGATCPTELTTLALTGSDPTAWVIGALALLQLGLALLAVRLVRGRRTGRRLS